MDSLECALQYLKEKYGFTRIQLAPDALERLNEAEPEDREALEASFTDDDYVIKINEATERGDQLLFELLDKYHLGDATLTDIGGMLGVLGVKNNS